LLVRTLTRRWPVILGLGILLSGSALLLTRPGAAGETEAEAVLRLREEHRHVSAGELLSLVPDYRPFHPSGGSVFVSGERATVRTRGGEALRRAKEEAAAIEAGSRKAAKEAVAAASAEAARRLRRAEDERAGSSDAESRRRELERQRGALEAAAAGIERQVEEVRARQDRTTARIRTLEADEHRFREALPAGRVEDDLRSPVLDRLRREMDQARSEIALGGLSRRPESAEFRKLAALLERLEEEHRTELYRVRGRTIVALRDSLRDHEAEAAALGERRIQKSVDLLDVEERLRALDPKPAGPDAGLEDLARRLALVRDSGQGLIATVESPARELAGPAPASPLPWIAGAFVLAFLAAWLREAADTKVRGDADVKRWLNLPCLALAEKTGGDPFLLRREPDALGESYATAATVLRSYLQEHEYKCVLVASASPGEGKTTAAANLGVALARKGLNVLLVDADLRAPRLHELFGVDPAQGLATWLTGGEDPNYFAAATEVASLQLLPAGPAASAPPEALESQRMSELLRAVRERYDVVVVDSPPLLGVGESLSLARAADTSVWVVRAHRSDARTLGWAKHLLRNVRADVAGVLLNFASKGPGSRLYGYGGNG
jgi:capsular exopolysaccharide synthesis family protein